MPEAVVRLAFAAQMDDLPLLQKFGKGIPDSLIDDACAQASAHDHQNRFMRCKAGQSEGGASFSFQQLLTDRAAGQDGLVFRKVLERLRKIAADLCGAGHAQLVGKSGCQVGFMADNRDMPAFGCHNDGDGDEAAFREDNVGLQLFHQGRCLREAFDDPERVGEILPVKITAEFSGRNAVIGDLLGFHELFLDAVGGTDVSDRVACGAQPGQQGNVRGYVAGGTAAGEYDMFHMDNSPP